MSDVKVKIADILHLAQGLLYESNQLKVIRKDFFIQQKLTQKKVFSSDFYTYEEAEAMWFEKRGSLSSRADDAKKSVALTTLMAEEIIAKCKASTDGFIYINTDQAKFFKLYK